MKEIKLSKGKVALVDDSDYEYLVQWKWRAWTPGNGVFYALKNKAGECGITMHRLLMGLSDRKIFVDHIDGDGLNNQRNNLRPSTTSQNQWNSRPRLNGTSKYKGVFVITDKYNGTKYFNTQVRANKKSFSAGRFPFTPDGEISAAKARDELALKIHGEFARLNFQVST